MANTIKIKRGLSTDLNNASLQQGELAMTTDTYNLYVGVGSGDYIKIGGGPKNILDGEARYSVRTINSASESDTYKLGECAFAEGKYTKASGEGSHAEGMDTTASGNYSHAEGLNAQALGFGSHAEGFQTTASRSYSHAEGDGATASGDTSHAEGGYTTASGLYSHAEGYHTTASGARSHAEGKGTTASGENQQVQGKYNIEDTTNAHIVGNGNGDDTRSNAHTIDWSGNAWFAGNVYTGSTSGTNKDEGSKKLATEEYVNNLVGSIDVSMKEDKSNKVTSISPSSTDDQYPTAKAVYNYSKDIISTSDLEPTTEQTQLWIEDDVLTNIGTEVVNSLDGDETNKAPSVKVVKEKLANISTTKPKFPFTIAPNASASNPITYYSEYGMTFQDWVNSQYNDATNPYTITNNAITGGPFTNDGGLRWVNASDFYTSGNHCQKTDFIVPFCKIREGYSCCFQKGSQVLTSLDGATKNIEDLKENEQIVVYNENTKQFNLSTIKKTTTNQKVIDQAKVILENNNDVIMNAYHPLLTTEGYHSITNYKNLPTLTENDTLITFKGPIKIKEIIRTEIEPTIMYNLSVNGKYHNFIVNSIVAHNAAPCK